MRARRARPRARRSSATSPSRSGSTRRGGGRRGPDARDRAHGRRDRGDHRQPGHRPATRGAGRRRRRRRAQRRRDRAPARLPRASLIPEAGAALSAAGALMSDLARRRSPMPFVTPATRFDLDGVNARARASSSARCRRVRRRRRARRARAARSSSRSRRATRTRSGRSRCRCAAAASPTRRRRAALVADFHARAPASSSRSPTRRRAIEIVGVARAGALPRCASSGRPGWRVGGDAHGADAPAPRLLRRTRLGRRAGAALRDDAGRRPASPARRSSSRPFTTVVVDPGATVDAHGASGSLAIGGSTADAKADRADRGDGRDGVAHGGPRAAASRRSSARWRTRCSAPARSGVLNTAHDFSCCILTARRRAAGGGREPADPRHDRARPDGRATMARDAPGAARAATPSCTTRPITATRTPADHCAPRAGHRRRRRAPLHGARQGPPGRLRQLAADDLYRRRARRLRGGRADLPGGAGPARLPGHRGHHPHVPRCASACPSSGGATTSRCSAPPGSASASCWRSAREVGWDALDALRRGLVRLQRAADGRGDPAAAQRAGSRVTTSHDPFPGVPDGIPIKVDGRGRPARRR